MGSRNLLDISLTKLGLQSGLHCRRNLVDMVNMKLDRPHFGSYRMDTGLRLLILQERKSLAVVEWLSRNQMSLQGKVSLPDKSKQMLHFHQHLYSKSPPDT